MWQQLLSSFIWNKVLTEDDGEDDLKAFMNDQLEPIDQKERKEKILIIGSES